MNKGLTKKKYEDYILNGRIREGIQDFLLESEIHDHFRNLVLTLRTDLERLDKGSNLGIISQENFSVGQNKITYQFLNILDDFLNGEQPSLAHSQDFKDIFRPLPLEEIYGREQELDYIRSYFQKASRPLLLYGISGIGKTHLIRAYATRHSNSYDNLLWVTVMENERLDDAFIRSVARMRHSENWGHTSQVRSGLVKANLRLLRDDPNYKQRKNLLVLDNVKIKTTSESEIIGLLEALQNWDTILASTSKVEGVESIEILGLQTEDTLKLFKRYCSQPADDSINETLSIIGNHPLSVELIAKTVNNNYLLNDLAEFNEYLLKNKLDDEDLATKINSSHNKYWNLTAFQYLLKTFSFNQLTEEEEYLLLNLSVGSSNYIDPRKILEWIALVPVLGSQKPSDDEYWRIVKKRKVHYQRAIERLVERGLLHVRSVNEIHIHSIIKTIVRSTYVYGLWDLKNLIFALCEELSFENDLNIVPKLDLLSISKGIIDNLIDFSEDDLFLVYYLGNLSHNLSRILKSISSYDEAIHYELRAIELLNKGRKYVDDSAYVNSLANCYGSLSTMYAGIGDIAQAVEINDKYLSFLEYKEIVNKADLRIIGYNNQASILFRSGEEEKMLKPLKKSLELLLSRPERNNERIGSVYVKFGYAYNRLENYKLAVDSYRQALEYLMPIIDENHTEILNCHEGLAGVYYRAKNIRKAMKHYKKAINIIKRIYGNETLELYKPCYNLADIYFRIGRISDSLECFFIVDVLIRKYFPDDPTRLYTINADIGNCYLKMDNLELAKKHFELALQKGNNVFTPSMPLTIQILQHINRKLGDS